MKKIILIFICLTATIFGQGSVSAPDARSAGMAKTYVASSNGVFSIGINPANLSFNDQGDFQLATVIPLPNLNLGVGTDFMSIDEYNYFFGDHTGADGKKVGRTLTDADKTRLLNLFDGGGNVSVSANVSLLSAAYKVDDKIGAFGFSINDIVAARINFPKDIVNLAMNGNPLDKVYNFDDTDFKAWWLRDYSLTYSRDLSEIPQTIFQKITAGVTLKYVQGFAYAGTEHVKTSLQTNPDYSIVSNGDVLAYSAFSQDFNVKYDFDPTPKKDADVSPFPKPAGSGFGFDLGFSAKLNEVWAFGLAITDIGSVKWTENAAQFSSKSAFYLTDIGDKEQTDSLRDNIVGKGESISEFSTNLPTALRAGATFRLDKFLHGNFPGTMLIAADFNQGFNDQPGNSKDPRLSLGAEWKPNSWLPIRTGLSFGGVDKFNWAMGLGFDTGLVEFNFATPDFHYLFMANSAKRISLAIGTLWKF